MKPAAALLVASLVTPLLLADDRNVDFDPSTDFSSFKTFTMRQGQVMARAPELRNPIVERRIAESIRKQLTAKGLSEVPRMGDLVVNWRLGAVNQRELRTWPAGRWGRATRVEAYRFTEGTLTVDLLDRARRELVWRGIYRDDESKPSKISDHLPDDVRKLFSQYPPKKK
jgi:hypothetical protein